MQRKSRHDSPLFGGPGRVRVCCFLGIGSLLAAAGCGQRATPIAPAPQRIVLRVACPDATSAAFVERFGGRWSSKAGARLQVARYDPEIGLPANGSADVWILGPAHMPRAA